MKKSKRATDRTLFGHSPLWPLLKLLLLQEALKKLFPLRMSPLQDSPSIKSPSRKSSRPKRSSSPTRSKRKSLTTAANGTT